MEPIKHLSKDEPAYVQAEALSAIAASLQKDDALALLTQAVSEISNTTNGWQLNSWQAVAASLTPQLGTQEGKLVSNEILEAI